MAPFQAGQIPTVFWLTSVIHNAGRDAWRVAEPGWNSLRRFAGLNLLSPKRFTREKSVMGMNSRLDGFEQITTTYRRWVFSVPSYLGVRWTRLGESLLGGFGQRL